MPHPVPDHPQEPLSTDEFVVDDEPRAPEPPPRDDLDEQRIRRIAQLRRSTYRSASYCLVGAAACWVAIAQLAWLIFRNLHLEGFGWTRSVYLLIIPVVAAIGLKLSRRAAQLRQNAKRTHLEEVLNPPDFSALGDGREPWRNMERIQ